jgi:hypothetical protein
MSSELIASQQDDRFRALYTAKVYELLMQALHLHANPVSMDMENAQMTAEAWTAMLIGLIPIDSLELVFRQAFYMKRESYVMINAVDLRLAWESLWPDEVQHDHVNRTFDLMATLEFTSRGTDEHD